LQATKQVGAQGKAGSQTASKDTPDNQNSKLSNLETPADPNPNTAASTNTSKPTLKQRKLSYKEQRELEGLPERIAALEAEQKQVQADLADPKLYASNAAKVAQLHARDVAIESELMQALERWESLSA
jgi:ATP-binding cassette subfamily F protein uup